MSRNWQAVSKAIQQLAAGWYAAKSEGMFPYDTHYVLGTDEEIERLNERAAQARSAPQVALQLLAQ